MRISERLMLTLVWLTFLASVSTAAFNLVVHPFNPYPKEDPTFLVIDDQGKSHINIDFTTEAYRASFIFQRRLCQTILLVFLFSSKILILVHLRNPRLRAWLYFLVIICSFLCYVMVPTIFFFRDNSRPSNMSLWKLMIRLPLELLLVPLWIAVWGIVQLFLLGWIWI